MRWTHHVESADAGLEERMWQILAVDDVGHVGRRDWSMRSGLYLAAGGVPVVASFVWVLAYAFGLGVR